MGNIFKGLLTENRERYLREQENKLGLNHVGIEKMNLGIETLKTTIKFLKSNTSCGFGGVPAESLKSGTERLYDLWNQIFEHCFNVYELPNDWKIGKISVIRKKGKKDECQNYKGDTVLNIFSRLYGKILKQFLEKEFFQIETEGKAGFRAGRSTIDHIFFLRQLIEKKMVVNQPLHILFVDLEKADNSVPLKNL